MSERASSNNAILLLEALHPDATELLAGHARVIQVETPEQALAVARSGGVVAILTRGKGQITRELMRACIELRVVSRVGAGVDTIDLDTARAGNISVIYAPGVNAATTAEHTLMLMLMITRRAHELTTHVRAGNWAVRNDYVGVELRWKTLGIFGMGAIGREVAQRAKAFGMQVLCVNRKPITDAIRADGVEQTTLPDMLARSDLVSLHVPLTEETRGIFGAQEFSLLKPGAFLINSARGALVDKAALARALESRQLAGYAADVFAPQPPEAEDLSLINHPNVILTPHVAGLTDATYRQVCLYCARNVLAVLSNSAPDDASVYRARS
jgi:D-3-phosphoglycerate dehydrogenase / 2-oxoglutarate reductase